ncbi:hypothetical protein PR048_011906 [Dryococelus australis]|uniref:Uncharacterized protein n=1 Tax=Dryococelus australis TaxID=614101 RepID=A0ABQ9HMY7_9NEOP|nr:hypothetical protein PR048_011906 [Dryococelus australis]
MPFLTGHDTLKAEILWALKVCSSQYSYKFCDISQIFKQMREKMRVHVLFWYCSLFSVSAYDSLKKPDSCVLLFDESISRKLQEMHLD